jgi:DNA-binding response OmpR family regulator
MSTALLLAQAEPGMRFFLERHLASDGFEVVASDDVRELRDMAAPDVVLLGDPSVLERLHADCPVIVLGAPGSDSVERVRAFERGCDDYLPRPFEYAELVARIHAVLRRVSRTASSERLRVRDLEVDVVTRRVTLAGAIVQLPAKEYELLVKLASDPRRVFTKQELLRDVWGFRAPARTRTLDSHASRLRRRLADAGGGGYVVNVWGVGYKLVSD